MSLQVGFFCYATQADAAAAACAAHVPVVSVSGENVVVLSCAGTTSGGGLQMVSESSPLGGGPVVSTTHELPVTFRPCMYSDVVAAGLLIAAALLALWGAVWGWRYLIRLIESYRSEQ